MLQKGRSLSVPLRKIPLILKNGGPGEVTRFAKEGKSLASIICRRLKNRNSGSRDRMAAWGTE